MNEAVAEYSYDESAGDAPGQSEADIRAEQLNRLNALSSVLQRNISDAISGRQACGIEREWDEDEEFYEGVDALNRGESTTSKPTSTGGPTFSENQTKPTGSTVFPNITRPYVDAAAARSSDMLLPTDDQGWQMEPTAIPELIGMAEGKIPASIRQQVMRENNNDQEAAEGILSKLADDAKQTLAVAREAAKKAERQILDWHIECQYHAQVRSVLEDTSRIGTGVLKGPVPVSRRRVAYKGGQLIVENDLKPASFRIDPRNFFPDPACGEDIQNGSFAADRDDITSRRLSDLRLQPGYIKSQINACLQEGPQMACAVTDGNSRGLVKRDKSQLFEIWYYYGQVKVQDYLAALHLRAESGEDVSDEAEQFDNAFEHDTVYVHAVIVNGRIIRVVQNPLSTGEFPYDVMVWQKRSGQPWGIGVARQVRTAQRIIIAGWRNMMDNAGKAAGPQVLLNDEYVVPVNGIYEFVPWKLWRIVKALDPQMRQDQVFGFIKIDAMQKELAAIIEMGQRLAEDATGLPMIMQGQTNSATPDTVGGMQLQEANASTVLRRIARLFDDRITERHIRRYYTYLLEYGDDDSCKGDFTVNAMGSSALVERALQAQNIMQIGTLAQNPVYGIDPKKWAAEALKSLRLDATRFEFDDEEWKQVVEKMLQPPPDPRIEIAQLREHAQTERTQMQLASKENTVAFEAEKEAERQAAQQEFLLLMEQFGQDVTAFEEEMENGRTDKQLKARLAETAARLRAQIQLSREANTIRNNTQVAHPAVEPQGRAANGQAFQQ